MSSKRSRSICARLLSREIGGELPGTRELQDRRLYEQILPNYALFNVQVPNCSIRRFTPDGKHAIQMYNMRSLSHISNAITTDVQTKESTVSFSDLFSLKYEKSVTEGEVALVKDFCLFSEDTKYMILASSMASSSSSSQESTPYSLNCLSQLDDVTFYLIAVQTGEVLDKRVLQSDYVLLSHHVGVHLYQDLFGVLSLQHQIIHLFRIKDGRFVDLCKIGAFLYEDDEMVISQYRNIPCAPNSSPPQKRVVLHSQLNFPMAMDSRPHSLGLRSGPSTPPRDSQSNNDSQSSATDEPVLTEIHGISAPISGLKQRLLSFLFHKARANDGGLTLRQFYCHFNQFASLILWKFQFLDHNHLLIKFGTLESIFGKNSSDSGNQVGFFVIYEISTTKILAVYDNSSEEFLKLFERNCDILRDGCMTAPTVFVSNSSNNVHAREQLVRQQAAVRSARHGGNVQAVRRALAVVPHPPQLLSTSPYLDQAMFSYDERVISPFDKVKQLSDYPIKFYARDSSVVKFKLAAGSVVSSRIQSSSTSGRIPKRYSQYIFHPTDPFIISVEHMFMHPSVVNVYLRFQPNEL